MNTNTTAKSRSDSAQQFARGFAFVAPAIQSDDCSGRFILNVEYWWQPDGCCAEFESETALAGAELVEFCRFLGGCLLGSHPWQWKWIRQKADRVLIGW